MITVRKLYKPREHSTHVVANIVRYQKTKEKIKVQKLEQISISETQKNDELHVILGANGNSGRYVADELKKLGYKVRGISRSGNGPDSIEMIKADALNFEELTNAVKGASVIYHCLGIPYPEWFDGGLFGLGGFSRHSGRPDIAGIAFSVWRFDILGGQHHDHGLSGRGLLLRVWTRNQEP